MANVRQLSANEQFDDFTGLPLGEGYITLQSSAGNRLCFNSPATMYQYLQAPDNRVQFNTSPDNKGSYNDIDDPV